METEKMIRELENVAEKHKNDFVCTGKLNISEMCNDVVRKLKELSDPSHVIICDRCANNGLYNEEVKKGDASPCTTCRVKYFDNFDPSLLNEDEYFCTLCRKIIKKGNLATRFNEESKRCFCIDCVGKDL